MLIVSFQRQIDHRLIPLSRFPTHRVIAVRARDDGGTERYRHDPNVSGRARLKGLAVAVRC